MIYIHNKKESSKARAYKRILKLLGANRKLLLELDTGRFIGKKPSQLYRFHHDKYDIKIHKVCGRDVFTLGPDESRSEQIILYLHGGAYVHNLLRVHWNLIFDLIDKTGATFVVPDYPLAPESFFKEVYEMVETVYADILKAVCDEKIIVMGDSAGGGLALGLMQKLRDEGIDRLGQLILLSPWLDLTMNNPEAREVEGYDILLKVEGLKRAGKIYARNESLENPMLSPIFGHFDRLGTISFFSSTNDVLVADAHALKAKLDEASLPYNYYEYPGMFHGWMTIVGMEEAQAAIEQIKELILT